MLAELVESGLYCVDFVVDGFELGFFFGAVFAEVFEAFEQAVGLKARGGLSRVELARVVVLYVPEKAGITASRGYERADTRA